MPKGHPLTLIEKPNLTDALAYPLITSAQTSTEPSALAGLGDYRIVATYNLLYNASLLVKAGVGIALCLGNIIDTSYPDSDLTFVHLLKIITTPYKFSGKNKTRYPQVPNNFSK
ncbi:LysR family transcriptional regulator [Streptococcus gallolyticus]|uniref:LysR family transcriptional regulator n=1 Tax=Streptococcus gallolyticus TaxID=315405 RepID=A0A380K5Y1_9STRE|nr:LysR family transcriptional regulator [Streptococcus gallolyticus]